MLCRMCLLEAENTLCIFDENSGRIPIAPTIAKHFWFEPKRDDPVSIMICTWCWLKIENFHEYYASVEDAQRRLLNRKMIKEEDILNTDVKLEYITGTGEIVDQKIVQVDVVPNNEGNSKNLEAAFPNDSMETGLGNQSDNVDSNDDSDIDNSRYPETHETDSSDDEPLAKKLIPNRKRKRAKAITPSARKIKQSNETKIENESEEKHHIQRRSVRRGRPKLTITRAPKEKLNERQPKAKGLRRMKSEPGSDPSPIKDSEYQRMSQQHDAEIAQFMKLRCDQCNMECETFAEIKRHYREKHNRKGYVSCCSSRKFYKRVFLYEHIQKHKNPEYFKCKYCDKVYCGASVLRSHMLTHDASFEKLYQCDKCPRRFGKLSVLNHHKVIHIPKEEHKFSCDVCGKLFPTKNTMETHRKSVHEKAYSKMCHICAKVISGKTLFAKHQLEHVGVIEPKMKCEICGLWLKNEFRLKIHTKKHHTQEAEGEHFCHICGKVSKSRFGLKSHIRYVHAATRKYLCSVCDKGFKTALNLKEHMTTHTGDVLYTCPHCPKTFNSSANMHSHRKKIHLKEWEESRRSRGLPLNSTGPKVSKMMIEPKEETSIDGEGNITTIMLEETATCSEHFAYVSDVDVNSRLNNLL